MPSRNVVKEFAADQYYHVYNRGVEKRAIFLDEQDYVVFLGLLKKYLTGKAPKTNKENRHRFDSLAGKVDLLAYCLMPNHIHLLFYQHEQDAITKLMRRIMTAYVMYFNERYNRVGALFQGRYKASHINADDYLHHISRYIHMNPDEYQSWPYSSYGYYAPAGKATDWVKTEAVLSLFDGDRQKYRIFLEDYEANKHELSVLKWQLANDVEES